jgi:isopentenyl-diphosphate delta-isomerase
MKNNGEVILVNEKDEPIGIMEKLEAHQKGLLHRAFSIIIFNDKQEILIQKRANNKYHSAGLWTNTCCSHPQPEEKTLEAAHRRLMEEMGLECELEHVFHFTYITKLENQLIEHELDHVFTGITNENPILNSDEASAYKWVSVNDLKREIEFFPEHFTYWFKIIIQEHLEKIVASITPQVNVA